MKFIIKHDIKGRLRIHMAQSRMSYEEADTLLYYIETINSTFWFKKYDSEKRMVSQLKQRLMKKVINKNENGKVHFNRKNP